jgi:thymidylate kinase
MMLRTIIICLFQLSLITFSFSGEVKDSPNLIVAIEGMPGTGKTSSLLDIIGRHSHNITLLSETNPEPGEDIYSLNQNEQTNYFQQLWIERMKLIRGIPYRINFLLDRSFYSNLAYIYAKSKYDADGSYQAYLDRFLKEFQGEEIDLLIILDASPEISLNRRKILGEPIPHPWNKIKFLEYLRHFYHCIMPKLVTFPIITINTDTLSLKEVTTKVEDVLKRHHILSDSKDVQANDHLLKSFLSFAHENGLGNMHSKVVDVFGYPTIYLQRHSLQKVNNKFVLFNNRRLHEVSR